MILFRENRYLFTDKSIELLISFKYKILSYSRSIDGFFIYYIAVCALSVCILHMYILKYVYLLEHL